MKAKNALLTIFRIRENALSKLRIFTVFSLAFFIIPTIADAKNYYVKNSGKDSNTGLSDDQAWQTIAKVNSSLSGLSAGDSILFRKGDTFIGSITITKSGTAGHPIVIGAYGNGENPIITGFTDISGSWTNVSGNIYRKTISTTSNIRYLIISNKSVLKGRYPNTGQYYITGGGTKNYFEDNVNLTQVDNHWNGAEVVVTLNKWQQELDIVSDFDQSDHRITFTSGTDYLTEASHGYFIQNSIHCLTDNGDWMCDGSNVYLYYTSDPSSLSIKASIYNTGIDMSNNSYINIKNISFSGYNLYAVYMLNSNNINIKNSKFTQSVNAIYSKNTNYFDFSDNEINDIHDIGIHAAGWNSTTRIKNGIIKGNKISYVGMHGSSAGIGLCGIACYYADFVHIYKNDINYTGYSGIQSVSLANVTIEKNRIRNYCTVLDDGGGIYTADSYLADTIRNNYLEGTGQAIYVTNKLSYGCMGVYLDVPCENVYVSDNLSIKNLFNYLGSGSSHCTWFNNWSTKATTGKLFLAWGGFECVLQKALTYTAHDNVFKNNKFIGNYRSSFGENQHPFAANTIESNNKFDYNYYLLPTGNINSKEQTVVSINESTYTLAQWKAIYGGINDKGDAKVWSSAYTHTSQDEFVTYDYNFSEIARSYTFEPGWTYYNIDGNEVSSLILRPYEGCILYRINNIDLGLTSTPQTIKVTGITVSGAGGSNIIASKGGTLQLYANVVPENATNKTVTWSFSNVAGQAIINSTGLVTAINNGYVTAKATANDGSGVAGFLTITISNQVIPVTGIFITGEGNTTTIISEEGTLQLIEEVIPDNATNKTVTWEIVNGTGQATINSSGLVNADAAGTVTAIATATDGSMVSGNITITIQQNEKTVSDSKQIYIDPSNSNDLSQDGTKDHPYSSWNKFTWKTGFSYLQKKGTVANVTKINIGASNVTLGSYGEGDQPIIQSDGNTFALQAFDKNNILIKDLNIINANGVSSIYIIGETCDSICIENCTLESAENGVRILNGKNVILRYNTFVNCLNAIYCYAENSSIYYNVFRNNEVAINVMANMARVEIFNNVFYSNAVGITNSYSELTLYNNIFYLANMTDKAFNNKQLNKLVSDNNIFYPQQEGFLQIGGELYSSLENYQHDFGLDLNSITSDPEFVDAYNYDFSLEPNSPAINAGRQVGLQQDFFGTGVPMGGIPDIGLAEMYNPSGSVTSSTSILNDPAHNDLQVYPNPSLGVFNVCVKNNGSSVSIITIKDLTGKTVYENKYSSDGDYLQEINLSAIKKGIYIVVVEAKSKSLSQPIIIM